MHFIDVLNGCSLFFGSNPAILYTLCDRLVTAQPESG